MTSARRVLLPAALGGLFGATGAVGMQPDPTAMTHATTDAAPAVRATAPAAATDPAAGSTPPQAPDLSGVTMYPLGYTEKQMRFVFPFFDHFAKKENAKPEKPIFEIQTCMPEGISETEKKHDIYQAEEQKDKDGKKIPGQFKLEENNKIGKAIVTYVQPQCVVKKGADPKWLDYVREPRGKAHCQSIVQAWNVDYNKSFKKKFKIYTRAALEKEYPDIWGTGQGQMNEEAAENFVDMLSKRLGVSISTNDITYAIGQNWEPKMEYPVYKGTAEQLSAFLHAVPGVQNQFGIEQVGGVFKQDNEDLDQNADGTPSYGFVTKIHSVSYEKGKPVFGPQTGSQYFRMAAGHEYVFYMKVAGEKKTATIKPLQQFDAESKFYGQSMAANHEYVFYMKVVDGKRTATIKPLREFDGESKFYGQKWMPETGNGPETGDDSCWTPGMMALVTGGVLLLLAGASVAVYLVCVRTAEAGEEDE